MTDSTPSLPPDEDEAAERLWQLWQQGRAPDVLAFLATAGPLSREQTLEVLRVDQRERWERGERVPVEFYVDQIESLRGDADGLLDLVYDEICLREARRETPHVDEYLTRFPQQAERIRRQFDVHRALADTADPESNSDMTQQDGKAGISADSKATWLLNDATVGPPGRRVPTASKVPDIPGYEILGEIDRGGMGVVYKARQVGLNRIVALKMILAGAYAGQEQKARFRIEAEAVARLQHPNIIQIYEVGEHDGQPFFSLEYAEGGSLAQRLCGTPQPVRKAAQMLAILARAVHAAHQCGIVHRDLKPANVLLAADGVPKLTDFGLAKQLGANAAQTRSGIIMGTPSYMAPEQAVGKTGEITPATDLYALGAILYEMLTGRPPFVGDSFDTLQQVLLSEPIHPMHLQPSIPRDLETICLKCLAKEPRRRYSSGLALADDLQRFLDGEPIRARRVPWYERGWKWARRRPAVAGLTALVLLVGILGLVGVLAQWHKAVTLQTRAEKQLYALSIAHAEGQLGHGDVVLAQQSLAKAPRFLRNWEWHYLQRLCQSSRVTLRGHEQDATCVAYDSSGELLATGGKDLSVRIWDAHEGRELHLLSHPPRRIDPRRLDGKPIDAKRINAVAFHRDGRRLASCDESGSIIIWPFAGEGEPIELSGHDGFVSCLAFRPLSEQLVSGGEDNVVRVWDLVTNRLIRKLEGHTNWVLAVACSPDGRLIASASKDGTIRLWDAAAGTWLRTLTGHQARVTCVAFSPDGRRLASCDSVNTIRLWNPANGEQLALLSSPASFVSSVEFQPNSDRLAAVCGEPGRGEVKMWDLASSRLVPGMRSQSRQVTSLAFSPAGDRLATALADGSVHVIEPDLALGSMVLQGHGGMIAGLACAPDSQRIASVGHDHQLILWDAVDGRLEKKVGCSKEWLLAVAYSGDGRSLAVAGQDTHVYILDPASGQTVQILAGHSGAVYGLAFNRDGSRLASGGEDQALRIWDTKAQRVVHELSGHAATITCMAMTEDGKWLATGSEDESVIIWDVVTGRLHRQLEVASGHPRCLAFSRDGRFLAVGCGTDSRGEALIWDLQAQAPPRSLTGHKKYVLGISFRLDGMRLATASGDHTVKVWDLAEGETLLTLIGHTDQVQSVQFSPDGRYIAAGGVDGTVRIWNGAPLGDGGP